MLVPVIQISNLQDIRIPKDILQQLNVKENLGLKISNNKILPRPIKKRVRKNWKEAFQKMHNRSKDMPLT